MLSKIWPDKIAWWKSLLITLVARNWTATKAILHDLTVMLLLVKRFGVFRRRWHIAYGKARKYVAESLGVTTKNVDKLIKELAACPIAMIPAC